MIGDRLETGKIKSIGAVCACDGYARMPDGSDGAILYSSNGRKRCAFCDKISVPAGLPGLRAVLTCGMKSGGLAGNTSFSPHGPDPLAASIMKDGAPELTAIGGPVLMVDLDEFIEIDLASKVAVPQEAESSRPM